MDKLMLMAATAFALSASAGQAAILYDNGPIVDSSGLSIFAPPFTTYGLGTQTSANNEVADDFTVMGSWNVTSLDFYGYQTSAPGFSFTDVSWSIVSADVNLGVVVASGSTALTDGGFMGYRVTSNALGDQSRKIYRLNADVADFTLDAGSYFLRWSLVGSPSFTGPWTPPLPDSPGLHNAMQSIAGGPFSSPGDFELPFTINGTTAAVPEPATWAMMIGGLALVGASMRRRSVKVVLA